MNKNILRSVISYILAFLLSASVLFATVLSCFNFVACRNINVENAALKIMYYDKVKASIADEFSQISVPSGIPDRLMIDFIENNLNSIEVFIPINNIFKTEKSEVNFENIRVSLKKTVIEYSEELIESGELVIDEGYEDEFNNNIDELVDNYIEIIRSAILQDKFFSLYTSVVNLVNVIFMPAMIICAGIILFCAILIILLFKRKFKVNKYFYAAFGGNSLILILFPGLILLNNIPGRIGIKPEHIHSLFAEISNTFLTYLLGAGLVYGLIALILAIFIILKIKKINNNTNNRSSNEESDLLIY